MMEHAQKQHRARHMGVTCMSGRDPLTGSGIAITIEDGLISSIEETDGAEEIYLSAGLVDLQVNGYRGFDLNSPTLSVPIVSSLTRELLATGVTTFAPTLITASEPELLRGLATIAEARRADGTAFACIPFVHVEGPHISPLDGYRGAHPLEDVRPPSVSEFDRWQAACEGLVGLVTLSPHFPGSEEYIAALTERGVHVSIGHTHASAAQIRAAVDAGARLSTHLGNGIALQLDRHLNPMWPQLADDRLTASFIADGHHLSAEVLQAMVHAKGLDRSILVSDAVALAGMPPGRYDTPVGGQVELSADGRLSMAGARTLAGAAVPLVFCIGEAVRLTGLPLGLVLQMATANPGAFAKDRGRLVPGARADFFTFRWDTRKSVVRIEQVWLAGNQISVTPEG
jgi:N-acetylglucosamine-6-phosphate deacetylase